MYVEKGRMKQEQVNQASGNLFVIMRKPMESSVEGENENGTKYGNAGEGDPYFDAFYAVLSQVLDTPYQKTFFNVLEHLREIYLLRHPSGVEYVWECVEKFVCRLKVLRSPDEARDLVMRLLYETSSINGHYPTGNMDGCCCQCHHREPTSTTSVAPPRPPPLPPPQLTLLPPPQLAPSPSLQLAPSSPPQLAPLERKESTSLTGAGGSRRPSFAEMISNAATTSSLKPTTTTSIRRAIEPITSSSTYTNGVGQPIPIRTPPPPAPPTTAALPRLDDLVTNNTGMKLLPQQKLPQPKTKLKTFPWSKLPASRIVQNANNNTGDDDNVWIKAARRFDSQAMISAINFDHLESLFAAQTSSPPGTIERYRNENGAHASANSNGATSSNYDAVANGGDSNTLTRRRDASADINLLDRKRSLNVNIFLKQFRGGIDDLIELIATGCSHLLGLEKLRGLMKILPEPGELDILKGYTGDKNRLGNAERFFIALTEITNYRLRVESMLLKEEFLSMVDYIKPSVNTLIAAATDLKSSHSLQEVLYLLLLVGNYLNAGGYGGNAAGFKMSSLWKLVEIRANKPNVTLLHYVVAEIEKRNPKLLELPKELKQLDDASKLSFDTILSDFRHLKEKTDRISKQVAQTDADDEIRNQTEVFFEHAKSELVTIERYIGQVDRLRLELAAFFCEDANTFKLEEPFKTFASFCQRFSRAIDENAERRLQEEKAEMRRRLKEQQKAKKELFNQKVTFSESDPPRRLSEKYKSLLSSDDVLLPYHSTDSMPRAGRTAETHSSLINVLTSSTPNRSSYTPQTTRRSIGEEEPDGEFNPGSVLWRRSYNCKRRSGPVVSSALTNRERPPKDMDTFHAKPLRQRFEELVTENESGSLWSGSSVHLDGARKSQPESPLPSGSNVDKAVECSPAFAKTFPRREPVRIVASANDLDQTTSLGPDTGPVELRRSVWREQRRIRANSLLMDPTENGQAPVNDLNELLEILKIENGSNAAVRRRGSKVISLATSGSEDECNDNLKKVSTVSAPPEVPKADFDDVVRHCEKARHEIDMIGYPSQTTDLPSTSGSDSQAVHKSSGNQSNSFEECSVDFTLSASDLPDCISCNLVISCRGDDSASHSRQSPTTDQRDCVHLSTVAPSNLTDLLDEGFEEDTSNSTNCSSVIGIQSPPLLPSSKAKASQKNQRPVQRKSTTASGSRSASIPRQPVAVATAASQTRCSYQSGTKASTMKARQAEATNAVKPTRFRTTSDSSQKTTGSRSTSSSKVGTPEKSIGSRNSDSQKTDAGRQRTDGIRQRRAGCSVIGGNAPRSSSIVARPATATRSCSAATRSPSVGAKPSAYTKSAPNSAKPAPTATKAVSTIKSSSAAMAPGPSVKSSSQTTKPTPSVKSSSPAEKTTSTTTQLKPQSRARTRPSTTNSDPRPEAKTRIQSVPTTTRPQRLPFTNLVRSGTVSSSSSESDHRSPVRRRVPSSVKKQDVSGRHPTGKEGDKVQGAPRSSAGKEAIKKKLSGQCFAKKKA